MLIILCLYLVLVWLVFSRLQLLKWGWCSGSVTVLVGAFILAVFLAMFNYLTPSGGLTVISRVVEITPNVSGQVASIPVETNVPVKAGTVLFQIDPQVAPPIPRRWQWPVHSSYLRTAAIGSSATTAEARCCAIATVAQRSTLRYKLPGYFSP